MSTTKKLLPLSLVASLLLFSACGGGDTNTPSQNGDNKDKITVPKKISIDIPDSLKSSRGTGSTNKLLKVNSASIQSYGYQQLTSTITQAEDTIKSVKDNMKYLALMMPDIINACQDIPNNETCHINAGIIKLKVEGKTLNMGKIAYTQQDSNKKYQHIVLLDLKPTLESMGYPSVTKDLETVKWSTDENHIETFSDAQLDNESYTMQLRYDKDEYNSSKMIITDSFSDTELQGNFSLKLDENNDANHTVNIETTGNIQYGEEGNTFGSQGTVSDNGGFLISKGSYMGNSYAEKEIFDATGKLLQSTYCNNTEECQISDLSTWIKYDESQGGEVIEFDDTSFDNNFPEDIEVNFQEPLELTFTQSESFPEYTHCEILPSNYNGSLNEDDIYTHSIGSFTRFDDELFGIFLDHNEKNNINNLPILCNSADDYKFSQLSKNKKPILGFKE